MGDDETTQLQAVLRAIAQLTEEVQRLREGFPEADADGHRRYHEEIMQAMADRRRLRQELITHLLKTSSWAALAQVRGGDAMKTIIWGAAGVAALLGAVLALVLANWLYFAPRAEAAGQALEAANQRAGRALDANERCAADVDTANKAVAALKQAADVRAASAAAAAAEAQGRATEAEKTAADLARRRPSKPADLCGSLEELLTDAIKERRTAQ